MKKAITIVFLLVCLKTIKAQNITGTWEGVFTSDISKYETKRFYLRIEIVQDERNITGYFSTAPIEYFDSLEVVYKISGKLNKNKSLAIFRLINNGIEKTDIPYAKANAFLEFECHYEFKDSTNFLKGTWFPNGIPSRRSDGSGGDFKVKQVSSNLGILHRIFAKK